MTSRPVTGPMVLPTRRPPWFLGGLALLLGAAAVLPLVWWARPADPQAPNRYGLRLELPDGAALAGSLRPGEVVTPVVLAPPDPGPRPFAYLLHRDSVGAVERLEPGQGDVRLAIGILGGRVVLPPVVARPGGGLLALVLSERPLRQPAEALARLRGGGRVVVLRRALPVEASPP